MPAIEHRNMSEPDETRAPDKTTLEVVQLGDATVARLTLQPGWRWSECIRPVVGGQSCQTPHLGYLTSGRLHIVADDGTEADISAGETYRLQPGHDAWVVGDETVIGLEFEAKTAETYARG